MIVRRCGWSFVGAGLVGLCFASAALLVACGEEGVTPDCPPLTLYNVRTLYAEAGPDATAEEIQEQLDLQEKVEEERAAAVDAGCMTPLGDAQQDPVP
jgi:hypothetical protein